MVARRRMNRSSVLYKTALSAVTLSSGMFERYGQDGDILCNRPNHLTQTAITLLLRGSTSIKFEVFLLHPRLLSAHVDLNISHPFWEVYLLESTLGLEQRRTTALEDDDNKAKVQGKVLPVNNLYDRVNTGRAVHIVAVAVDNNTATTPATRGPAPVVHPAVYNATHRRQHAVTLRWSSVGQSPYN